MPGRSAEIRKDEGRGRKVRGQRSATKEPARSFAGLHLYRGFGIGNQFLKARIGAEIVPFRGPTQFREVDEAAFAQGYGGPGEVRGRKPAVGCRRRGALEIVFAFWRAKFRSSRRRANTPASSFSVAIRETAARFAAADRLRPLPGNITPVHKSDRRRVVAS